MIPLEKAGLKWQQKTALLNEEEKIAGNEEKVFKAPELQRVAGKGVFLSQLQPQVKHSISQN